MLQRLDACKEVRDADWRVRTQDGAVRDVLGCVEQVSLAGEDCLVVAAHDITDRKHADAEMRKLSRALEQTVEAVMITKHDKKNENNKPTNKTTTGYSS